MSGWRRFLGVFTFLFLALATFHLIVWLVSGTVPITRGLFQEATREEAVLHGGLGSFFFALIATPLVHSWDR